MINDTVQWACLVAVFVLVIGAFRQIALIVPPDLRAIPSGPAVGDSLPAKTLAAVQGAARGAHDGLTELRIAFISESCIGCRQLLADASRKAARGGLDDLVFVARDPSAQYVSAIAETGIPLVADESGRFWAECDVTATPLVVRVGADGKVKSREVMHRVEETIQSARSA